MPESEHNAFFYGTLMAPQVLHRVIYNTPLTNTPPTDLPNLLTTHPAILHNHRRHRVQHADYPAIIPCADSSVRGTFVTGLTSANIHKLDLFEGGQYERRVVRPRLLKKKTEGGEDPVITGEGKNEEGDEEEEVDAETYIWVGGEGYLEDTEWDFEEFRKEKLRFWVGGEDPYGEFEALDDAIAAEEENDAYGGRSAGGPIAQETLEAEHVKEGGEGKQEDQLLKNAV